MAEYINYGDQQIDQQALLTAMADNVQSYVNSQTWSNKRKEKFLNAYQDMLSGGIKGASIENGTWGINIGTNIDLSTMGKKDREMYQEAAYFIQNQMKNLLPKAEGEKKPEEEKEKEVFDFNKQFEQALLNSFGGSKETFKDNWSSLDSVQDNGLFSRTGRAAKIKQALQSLESIKESDYNFEKSSYGSHKNFTDKLNAAINALDNPDTAKEALLSLGVNYKGLLDDYADQKIPLSDGTEITRAEYAARQIKQQKEEQAKVAKKAELIKQGNRGVVTLTSGIHGTDVRTQPEAYSQYLAKTYGTGQQGFNRINQEIQGLLNKAYNNGGGNGLTAEEKRKLGNFLFYIRANNPNSKAGNWNITPQEWEQLRWSKYAISQNQNDYIRLPWQTSDGRYTFADNQGNIFFVKTSGHQKLTFNRSQTYNNYKNNFLKDINAQNRSDYLKSRKEGLTSAEIEELASIGFDIASIIDPEMITAGGLALAGSGLRHHAASQQPGGMSASDKWWQAADYGLSFLGSIPVLGDAALAARALNNLRKAVVPLGIVMAGANVPQVAKAAYNKVVNGQDLTIQDWRAIGAVITSAVSMGKSRQISKRAQALQRVGGNSSTKTTKYTIKTSQGEIKDLDESVVKDLKNKFKGTSKEVRTEAIRNHPKIQEAARKQGIDLSKAEVEGHSTFSKSPISSYSTSQSNNGSSTALSSAIRNYNQTHGRLSRWGLAEQDWIFRKTGGYETTPSTNYWESIKNLFKKSKWDDFGNNSTTSTQQSKSISAEETPKINRERINELREKFGRSKPEQSNPRQEYNQKQQHKAEKEIDLFLKSYGEGNNPSKFSFTGGYGSSKNKIKPGEYSFDLGNGQKISFKITKEDLTKKSIEQLRHEIQKQFKNQVINKTDQITTGNILRKLKKQGFLKQGGTIDKQRIQKYKEYIKK